MSKPVLLIVEDHPVTQKVITLLCEEYGFGCIVVGSGDEAIEGLKESHVFSMIFLDIKLPDGSGLDIVADLRLAVADRRIPIIAMSGLVDAETRRRCTKVALDDFLGKPFTALEFQAMVLKWTAEAHNLVQFPRDKGETVQSD